jgi:hypothetical protein
MENSLNPFENYCAGEKGDVADQPLSDWNSRRRCDASVRAQLSAREASISVGSLVNGVERHSMRSARVNPTVRRARSSTSSSGLIADRNSFAAHFLIIAISISQDAMR